MLAPPSTLIRGGSVLLSSEGCPPMACRAPVPPNCMGPFIRGVVPGFPWGLFRTAHKDLISLLCFFPRILSLSSLVGVSIPRVSILWGLFPRLRDLVAFICKRIKGGGAVPRGIVFYSHWPPPFPRVHRKVGIPHGFEASKARLCDGIPRSTSRCNMGVFPLLSFFRGEEGPCTPQSSAARLCPSVVAPCVCVIAGSRGGSSKPRRALPHAAFFPKKVFWGPDRDCPGPCYVGVCLRGVAPGPQGGLPKQPELGKGCDSRSRVLCNGKGIRGLFPSVHLPYVCVCCL